MSADSNTSRSTGLTRNLRTTLLLCFLLLLGGAGALALIFSTEPSAQRETAVRETAMLVETTTAQAGTFRPLIEAMGTVKPAREVILRPRVNGEVDGISDNFTPGGMVKKGEVLVRIDGADYRNLLQQRESELQQAIADLEIESGEQAAAESDYRRLGRQLPPEKEALILRQPQLRSAEARVQSARAAVEQAQLDLQRTAVKAPFDAYVLSRDVNVGSQVSVGDRLARLVGLQTYWVEVALPVDKLRWLSFADGDQGRGSPVRLRNRTAWAEGQFRRGYLYKLLGELEGQTRMARVLVAVEDPLARKADSPEPPPLMIGEFVEARLQGRELEGTLRLGRDHIRKNDTVWLMRDNRLAIRNVDIAFRDASHAYIRSGLSAQDRVVTTHLATVREGVSLRLKAADESPARADAVDREAGAAAGAVPP